MLKDNRHINEDWLKAVKKSADAFNEPVTEDKLKSGWESLEHDLAKIDAGSRQVGAVSGERRHFAGGRRIILWSSLAAAAVVLAVLILSPLHKKSDTGTLQAESQPASGITSSAASPLVASASTSPAAHYAVTTKNANAPGNYDLKIRFGSPLENGQSQTLQKGTSAKRRQFVMLAQVRNPGFWQSVGGNAQPAQETIKQRVNGEHGLTASKNYNKKYKKTGRTYEAGEPIRVSSTGRWTAGLMMRNAGGTKNNSGSSDLYASSPIDNSSMYTLLQAFAVSPSPVDYSHKQPISVGITVERKIGHSGKLSIESGVVYSLLNSDVAAGEYNLRQHIHYIGIPVAAKWNFVNAGRFTLYAEGGGMVEKGVAGRMENVDNKKLSSGKFKVRGLQFSVAADAGAEFKVYKNVGIYVQPGVSYYFKPKAMEVFYVNGKCTGSVGGTHNGNGRSFQLESIRTNNRVGLSLQAGIRLSY
ncbi:MAG: PorT family protein [Bacteroidales bacterium]|nr:PorT family protein [Bacteroidales bacterium]MCI1733903.1 PorT family protein [Bacteroidales bacterium]